MKFQLFTGVLKAWDDPETGEAFVRGTTSSTIRDLQGDEITLSALESMRKSALDNMTIFLNHDYNVPEDLFGSVTEARIEKRVDDEAGEVYDLDITVKVCPEDENPEAMRTYRAIKRGVKLGFSIGAQVTKHSRKVKDGVETFVIEGLRLLESSVVGIPANQRSYLHNAVKSLRGQPLAPDEQGIDRELEEKGLGDKVRSTIVRNEEAEAERVAEMFAGKPIGLEAEAEAPAPAEAVIVEASATEPAGEAQEAPVQVADTAPETTKYHPSAYDAGAAASAMQTILYLLGEEVNEPAQSQDLAAALEALQRFISAEAAEICPNEDAIAPAEPMAMNAAVPVAKVLEAAVSLKAKVVALSGELDRALAERAQVEADLATALGLLERALALPVGRKSAVASVVQVAKREFPWLAPSVERHLAQS